MKKIILLILSIILLCDIPAHASWPIGKNHFVFSSALSLYTAGSSWDRYGVYTANTGQKFYATTLGLYGAYGLTRRLDVTASIPVTYQTTSFDGVKNSNTSLGDFTIGLNYVLFNFKYSNYITVYLGTIAPLYTNSSTKYVGLGNAGANVKLSNSGTITESSFYNIDLGYAQYVGQGAPQQYLADLTLGYSLDRWDQVGINGGAVKSISSDKRSLANVLANRDFEYVKISANYGHSFTKRVNVNVSYFYTVAGRNTGQGYGGALSFLWRLPYR